MALMPSAIACRVDVAPDVFCEPLAMATDAVPYVNVEDESVESVIEGRVSTLLEALSVVVEGGSDTGWSCPTVLLPTTIGVEAGVEEAAATTGFLSAAIKASIVEEPVEAGVVAGVVLTGVGGKGAGGSAADAGVVLALPDPLKSPPINWPSPCPNCMPSMSCIRSELPPKRPLELKGLDSPMEVVHCCTKPTVLQVVTFPREADEAPLLVLL